MDGLELQTRLAAADPELTIVLMTAYASVETAVNAMKAGAYDYIVKPFDPDDLSLLVRRAAEHRSLRAENLRLKKSLESAAGPPPLLGTSAAMRHVLELVDDGGRIGRDGADHRRVGHRQGGRGARDPRRYSPRRYNPMVVVNCGALPEGILESELFGHEAGAFTGARARHKGKFEAAEGGTVFLDEIGDVSPKVQVELLRVLEEKKVTRLGGSAPVAVDFRTITATNRDLLGRGRVRRLPRGPLLAAQRRAHPHPAAARAARGRARAGRALPREVRAVDEPAADALLDGGARTRSRPTPGRATCASCRTRSSARSSSDAATSCRPPTCRCASRRRPRPAARGRARSPRRSGRTSSRCSTRRGWNITRAARILDVDRVTLYNKIRKYELKKPARRALDAKPAWRLRPSCGPRRSTCCRSGRSRPAVAALAARLSRHGSTCPSTCCRRPSPALPRLPGRGQLDAAALLASLEARAAAQPRLLVGVTAEDIAIAIFTFVFGLARQGGHGLRRLARAHGPRVLRAAPRRGAARPARRRGDPARARPPGDARALPGPRLPDELRGQRREGRHARRALLRRCAARLPGWLRGTPRPRTARSSSRPLSPRSAAARFP